VAGIKRVILIVGLLMSLLTGWAAGQEKVPDIKDIFTYPKFWGTIPSNVVVSPDEQYAVFSWNETGRRFKNLWLAALDTYQKRRLTDLESILPEPLEDDDRTEIEIYEDSLFRTGPSSPVWSPDSKAIYFLYLGDIWKLTNLEKPEIVRLTNTEASESNIKVSPDGQYLSYVTGNNIYLYKIKEGSIRQLTRAGTSDILYGKGYYNAWLNDDQTYSFSPDSKQMLVVRYDQSDIKKIEIPDYSGEFVTHTSRRKSLATGQMGEVKVGLIREYGQIPEYFNMGDTSQYYLRQALWSPKGDKILLDRVSTEQKDRWIIIANPVDMTTNVLWHEHDSAWIHRNSKYVFWANDGKDVVFTSDHDGYSHLYKISLEEGEARQLTRGEWEIDWVDNPEGDPQVFYRSTEQSTRTRNLYMIDINSGTKKTVIIGEGILEVASIPRGRFITYIDSKINYPPQLCAQGVHSQGREITFPKQGFEDYLIAEPEYVNYQSSDGQTVQAMLFKPDIPLLSTQVPAIVHIHGAGYSQVVKEYWRTWNLVHNYWAKELGFAVLALDYRGSSGYGRKWRTDIYRHTGGLDLEDAIAGVDYLRSLDYVDDDKIGIWGWSYGGFLTCMAMFKAGETCFQAGAAVASPTDWSNYNLWYTTQRFNTPGTDSIAYHQSSPINYADSLKGHLLLLHGMGDDNVMFQDAVQLVYKLIQSNKKFDLMIYPKEKHGFKRDMSYIHIMETITDYFLEHLKN
jgi:dipeptidyl-peptidase-4